MNVQNLLNQFMGLNTSTTGAARPAQPSLKGSFAGGAAVGGVAALLMGNKKARKVASKAATVGGAALLGGLAFSAFRQWQQGQNAEQNLAAQARQPTATQASFQLAVNQDDRFQLTLIKAMISAAKADGHIDETEQERIFNSVDGLQLNADEKAMVLDLLRYPATVAELAQSVTSLEQKSEVYLISCFAIDADHAHERAHLQELEHALNLPKGLALQLEQQAEQAALQAA